MAVVQALDRELVILLLAAGIEDEPAEAAALVELVTLVSTTVGHHSGCRLGSPTRPQTTSTGASIKTCWRHSLLGIALSILTEQNRSQPPYDRVVRARSARQPIDRPAERRASPAAAAGGRRPAGRVGGGMGADRAVLVDPVAQRRGARARARRLALRGLRIVELGCGLAVPSLAAARAERRCSPRMHLPRRWRSSRVTRRRTTCASRRRSSTGRSRTRWSGARRSISCSPPMSSTNARASRRCRCCRSSRPRSGSPTRAAPRPALPRAGGPPLDRRDAHPRRCPIHRLRASP